MVKKILYSMLLILNVSTAQNIQVRAFAFGNLQASRASKTQVLFQTGVTTTGKAQGSTFAFSPAYFSIYINDKLIAKKSDYGELPREFRLFQNYPNPFNSITTIEFYIPRSCKVSLKVYDVLGKEVSTLVQSYMESGVYKIQWYANVSSGIYFYRLQTDGYTSTKKMILIK